MAWAWGRVTQRTESRERYSCEGRRSLTCSGLLVRSLLGLREGPSSGGGGVATSWAAGPGKGSQQSGGLGEGGQNPRRGCVADFLHQN